MKAQVAEPRSTQRILAYLIPGALIATAIALTLASQVDSPILGLLCALNLVGAGLGIILSIVGGLRPVALFYFAFSFAWLGVAPVFQIATGLIAWKDTNALGDSAQVGAALAMNLLALTGFALGILISRARERRRSAIDVREFALPSARAARGALPLTSLGLLLVAPLAIQASGGFASLFTSRQDLAETRSALGTGFYDLGGPVYALTRILPGALAICVTILAIIEIRRRWNGVSHILGGHALALMIGVGGLLMFANPWTNSRFTAAAAFGAVLLVIFRPRSPGAATIVASLLLFATLLIYPLANTFRYGDSTEFRSGFSAFLGPDFDGFQQVINTLSFVQTQGMTYGNHVLSGIGFFIPRSIWPSKAEPASFAVAEHAGYVFTNLSLPIHAEFYVEFGWAGVLVGMLVLGFVAGTLDSGWLRNPSSVKGILAAYVALAVLGIVRGPIGAQVPVWGAVVLILLLTLRNDRPGKEHTERRSLQHRNVVLTR